VINESMKVRLGVRILVPKDLPPYPSGFDRQNEAWPKDVTGEKLTRLDCKQRFEDANNQFAFREILQHVKSNGPTLYPAAAEALREILEGDLAARVEKRVRNMLKGMAASRKLKARAEPVDGEEDDGEDDNEGSEAEAGGHRAQMKRSQKNARVQSVSHIMI
jgi:hypothetical protein